MPNRAAWAELFKETFHGVDRDDLQDLYRVEWQRSYDALIADHADAIASECKGWKRGLRRVSAFLFGITKRLAPTRRLVYIVAFGTFLLGYLQASQNGEAFDLHGLHLVSFVLLTFLLGMELVDKIQFRDELILARDVQADLIPKSFPEVPGFGIAAFNRIANTVGGDLYDFVALPGGRLAVLFGDASGHGMAAGLVMAVSHAAFRTQVEVDASPGAVFATLNRILCRTGTRRSFFAAAYLVFGPDGTFEGMIAGHPQLLKVAADGRIAERIGVGAYPIGIKPAMTWAPFSGTLAEGETLLLHSDGLSEARNAEGQEFGDRRIEAVVARKAAASAPELVTALSAELGDFLGRRPPEDDVSIAAVRYGR